MYQVENVETPEANHHDAQIILRPAKKQQSHFMFLLDSMAESELFFFPIKKQHN